MLNSSITMTVCIYITKILNKFHRIIGARKSACYLRGHCVFFLNACRGPGDRAGKKIVWNDTLAIGCLWKAAYVLCQLEYLFFPPFIFGNFGMPDN